MTVLLRYINLFSEWMTLDNSCCIMVVRVVVTFQVALPLYLQYNNRVLLWRASMPLWYLKTDRALTIYFACTEPLWCLPLQSWVLYNSYLHETRICNIIFMDTAKAFDIVPHYRLKLIKVVWNGMGLQEIIISLSGSSFLLYYDHADLYQRLIIKNTSASSKLQPHWLLVYPI